MLVVCKQMLELGLDGEFKNVYQLIKQNKIRSLRID